MRLLRRRAEVTSAAGSPMAILAPPFDGDDSTLAARIEELHLANRARPSTAAERELLALRHELGLRRLADPPADPVHPAPEPTAAFAGMPELAADAVTPRRLRAAILDGGGLIVRGLIPRERAERFARTIARAFAERDRHDADAAHDEDLYCEFAPDERRGEPLPRDWVKLGGGVLAVDSPWLSFELIDMFRDAGVPGLVAAYLGEPGLITAQKTTLRRAEPTVAGAWHQDGKFMGPVRALNLWVALSHCGDTAPGLDVVPQRLDRHLPTTSDEPPLDYLVSPQVAASAAGTRGIARPIFEPGDAMLFDELFLHQTGSDPAMAEPRFAIESWFFGASGFPADYAPLAV